MKKRNAYRKYVRTFGREIRTRRRGLGMSAELLAERVNRSDREILNIERGTVEPKLGTALLLCTECGIDIGELEEFVPQEEPSYV